MSADPATKRDPAPRANSRVDTVRDIAAELFSTKGFHETTMRDIAGQAGMLPGSIYYHFPSKEDLLVAVYEAGVEGMIARIEAADPGRATDPRRAADPWARLEAVMAAHVEAIVEASPYARVIIRVLPDAVPGARTRLIELRDAYEAAIAQVVAALPLAEGVDRHLLRLFLLGAANHVPVWHRPGGQTPGQIAASLVQLLRAPAGAAP